ncbi:MAG TPA: hydantoinase/oxoprolinase family protein, partial [Candidatus Korarchaeota archaeon]|nr:hydantoinase/oxoprolinase family protein [Candidatus Korarchaeota archaeon]
MGIRVGIDVGGTFTDLVAFNEGSGEVSLVKVPTTPRDPEVGVIDALSRFLRSTDPREVSLVSHATTLATNALLGQEGLELPLVALLTTEGFRDVLEIGRQRRPELYNLFFRRPRPLAPRRLRFGVRERIDYKGNVLIPLSKQNVEQAVTTALQRGAGAIAISFLHSYANPSHEKQAKEIAQKLASHLPVVASHEIDPEYREYERTSTTVVNAALIPVVSGYLKRLEGAFSSLRISAPRYVMQSSGGLASFEEAAKKPASLIESGPAAGIVASAWLGSLLGLERVIGFDMGGTTAKAGVVVNGRPEVTTEYEVGGSIHAGRIVKGSGYTVR